MEDGTKIIKLNMWRSYLDSAQQLKDYYINEGKEEEAHKIFCEFLAACMVYGLDGVVPDWIKNNILLNMMFKQVKVNIESTRHKILIGSDGGKHPKKKEVSGTSSGTSSDNESETSSDNESETSSDNESEVSSEVSSGTSSGTSSDNESGTLTKGNSTPQSNKNIELRSKNLEDVEVEVEVEELERGMEEGREGETDDNLTTFSFSENVCSISDIKKIYVRKGKLVIDKDLEVYYQGELVTGGLFGLCVDLITDMKTEISDFPFLPNNWKLLSAKGKNDSVFQLARIIILAKERKIGYDDAFRLLDECSTDFSMLWEKFSSVNFVKGIFDNNKLK